MIARPSQSAQDVNIAIMSPFVKESKRKTTKIQLVMERKSLRAQEMKHQQRCVSIAAPQCYCRKREQLLVNLVILERRFKHISFLTSAVKDLIFPNDSKMP